MSNMFSRRWLFGAALALVAVPPLRARAATVPVLYGDGIHDDTAGLQALLDGNPVMIDGAVVRRDEPATVMNRTFVISDTLVIRRSYTRLCGCRFRVAIDDDRPVLDRPAVMVRLDGNRFDDPRAATRRPTPDRWSPTA